MTKKTRILILEDQPTDAELEIRELRQAKLDFEVKCVETKESFVEALKDFDPDVIISDYGLPQFNGLEALRLLKELNLNIPFILCTGSLTEEIAVKCMKEGAADYILKSSLKRLPSAVLNVLEKCEAHKTKEEAVAALRDSEEWLKALLDASRDGIVVEDDGEIVYINKSYAQLFKYDTSAELVGRHISELLPPDEAKRLSAFGQRRLRGERAPLTYQFKGLCKDGTQVEVEGAVSTCVIGGKKYIMTAVRDITERKLVEETLRESDARYRVVTESASDAIITIDNENTILFVNPAAEKIFGYTVDEMLGNKLFMLIPERMRDAHAAGMARYAKTNVRNIPWKGVEVPALHKDGHEVPVEITFGEINSDGKHFFTAVIRDITARKLAAETLEKSERQYRFLSEGIMHQVWTVQPDGTLDYVNNRMLEYFGLTFKQIANDGWQAFIHPDDAADFLECWTKSVKMCEYFQVEFRLKKADGTYRWHLARAIAGHDPDGKIVNWFGTNTDINDKKLNEDALKFVNLQLETALEAGAIATWNYDILNNRIIADKKMAQLFSVSLEDAAGGSVESYLRAIHPDDRLSVEENLAQTIASETNYEMDYRIVKSDNTIRWVEARGHIERDTTGTATRMAGVIIDITERKKAEQSLLESEERLQQSQKMEAIGTLTGGVAHDFNNLLTAILGNTQLALRKLAPDDSIRPRLTEITEAGNRAAELTRKLLAFSRRQHLERRAVNLNNTIVEIVKLLERIIGEDVEVAVKYASDLHTVFADAGQIEQVVMNIAVNARDAMPSGGKVTIETSNVELDESYCRQYPYVVPGKYVEIRVSDSGTGIDEETQARVFEPFFTTKEIGKGTGLGLSMAYGIVKQHDGHINLYSELGMGTTFKIYLPAHNLPIEEKTEATEPSFLGGTETILIAEDEEILRNLAKATLEDLGYTVLLAKDGAEAVEIFGANREHIDLFLTDVIMTRMSGSEAYEQIREMGGNIPLIFMTGYSAETVQSRFVKTRVTAEQLSATVVQKPYTLEELGRVVRQVLDKEKV